MKEHAIPQDITGYKFHIVGNMTLKQFAEIAMGFVIAFFIYKTNLIVPVKWMLIIFSVGIGSALAFLPIEERPLDHWFITFFTILYKPTKFYWKKQSKVPDAFSYVSNQANVSQINTTDLTPQRRERISEYLQSVQITAPVDEQDLLLQQRSSELLAIFSDKTLKLDFSRAEKLAHRPKLKVEVRSLVKNAEFPEEIAAATKPIEPGSPIFQDEAPVVYEKPTRARQPLPKQIMSTDQVATTIEIPETPVAEIEAKYLKEQQSLGQDVIAQRGLHQEARPSAETGLRTTTEATAAILNRDLPFPIKPTKPNKLVGMVLSQDSDLINHATISLKDAQQKPVTAVKSNALGQFFITSQLPNGTYTIEVTKENQTFSPLQITLEGKTVDPLEIRSNE